MFNHKDYRLPISEIISTVKEHLVQHQTILVAAPPGAGKSTILPLTLLNEPWLQNKKIIMLEPRRLAARAVATRMAEVLNEPVGETVGYRVRFENKISKNTKLEVVTEGILTRMLLNDSELSEYGLVIFDEFHERSIHADVAFALCNESQQILRNDLKIIVMSATLNLLSIQKVLNAPLVQAEGKMYPVQINYTGETDLTLLAELTCKVITKAINENQGDILVFLPGEREILQCAEMLNKLNLSVKVHPLFGNMPIGEQAKAIQPNKMGKRKVVLATSIAETSLTIEGVSVVIDSGWVRKSSFDIASGLSRLQTVMISADAADQRTGRGGRLGPGVCYRMWTPATQQRLLPHRAPEIEDMDLTSTLLDLLSWGTDNVFSLKWITPPPHAAVQSAFKLLNELNAVEKNKITQHGKKIHGLACHPRIAHMLLKAKEDNCIPLAADIAAILEERDILPKDSGIDICLRIEAMQRARQFQSTGKRMERLLKLSRYYCNLFNVEPKNDPIDPYEAGILIAHAFPERIACARPGNNAQYMMSNGKIATAGHKDALSHEPWLAVANVNARDGLGKIFLAAPLNPKDLVPMVKQETNLIWHIEKGGLIASSDLKIGSIVLKSVALENVPQESLIQEISKVIKKSWPTLLTLSDEFIQLQNRVISFKLWNPATEVPLVDNEWLFEKNIDWLMPFLISCRKNEDLKQINLTEALTASLGWDFMQQLNQLLPAKIKVPSGSNIPIIYNKTGNQPIMEVRLQEVFGMLDTPLINDGKIAVVMHLLSPGFKPVQVTKDLKSFWNNTYFEVKKELKRRYPKHSWPDNPLEAIPVAKGGVRR